MIQDSLTTLSQGQQITADAVSTNTFDLGAGAVKRKIGDGEPMCVVVGIRAAGTNTGTMDIQFIQSAAANLSSPDVLTIRRLVTADLAAGKVHIVPIPPTTPTKQYIGLNYDVTGVVDVTVNAWITSQALAAAATPESYPIASKVS